MQAIENIENKLNKLTPDQIAELNSFLDYLITKSKSRSINLRKLKQNWAGGIKGIDYNSLELQKKALDWRQK